MIESLQYDKRSLGELLSTPIKGESESYFVVPRFQRKYEWEKENEVLRLITDVFDNLGKTYFMGPVIFCYTPGKLEVEIIDGQQRLVTFAIFLRALADYTQQKRNAGTFEEGQKTDVDFLLSKLRATIVKGWMKKREPVLHLSKVINKYFREDIVLNEDANKIEKLREKVKNEHPSIRRLREAYIRIFDELASQYGAMTGGKLLDKLGEISDSLINRQVFLSIVVQEYSDAFTIFETMNERGKRLTLSDLVKNLCFRKMHGLGEELLDEFEDEWDEVEWLVSDFGLFLWHAWVSQNGNLPRRRVFAELEKRVRDMSQNEVWEFSLELIFDEAEWYHTYEAPPVESSMANGKSKEKIIYLQMLKTMGATRCYPLLLSLDYAEKKRKTLTLQQTCELLKAITCLTFWYNSVCDKDAKELEKVYHSQAQRIRKMKKEDISKAWPSIIEEIESKFPNEVACKNDFRSREFTDKLVRMILRNLESTVCPGEKTLKSDTTVWIEHILPQKPESQSEWVKLFPDDKERKDYTYRIGNLTLLLDRLDMKAKNHSFIKKKEIYAESEIALTKELTELDKWDSEAIENRTEHLFNLAKKIWPIPSNVAH